MDHTWLGVLHCGAWAPTLLSVAVSGVFTHTVSVLRVKSATGVSDTRTWSKPPVRVSQGFSIS